MTIRRKWASGWAGQSNHPRKIQSASGTMRPQPILCLERDPTRQPSTAHPKKPRACQSYLPTRAIASHPPERPRLTSRRGRSRKIPRFCSSGSSETRNRSRKHWKRHWASRGGKITDRVPPSAVSRWDWSGHSFLLSIAEGEFVSLAIEPVEVADSRGKPKSCGHAHPPGAQVKRGQPG